MFPFDAVIMHQLMIWDGHVISYKDHVWHVWDLLVQHQDVEDNLQSRQKTAGDTHENHKTTTEICKPPHWHSTDERDEAYHLRKEK